MARATGAVTKAVMRDLGQMPTELAESGLAASALALAAELDDGENSATSKSMCARSLQEVLRELRSLAPKEEIKDGIDEIAERRAKRRAGSTAAADLSRP